MKISALERLTDALDAISKIERCTAGMTEDEFVVDWERAIPLAERWLLIVVETANQLKEPHLSLAFGRVSDLREFRDLGNAIRHAYSRVEPQELWGTIKDVLPLVKADMETMLRRIGVGECSIST